MLTTAVRRSGRHAARTVLGTSLACRKRDDSNDDDLSVSNKRTRRMSSVETASTTTTAPSSSQDDDDDEQDEPLLCLPRTLELTLQSEGYTTIMGVDEAGRGPLAGPVVAAAAILPTNIAGIVDSKKIAHEEERERLYEEIVSSSNVRWAVAVIDAARIDEINILQATLEGMRLASQAVMSPPKHAVKEASIDQEGCYVVCHSKQQRKKEKWFALIDGNRLPEDMPCDCDCVIKGDTKEYSIAAASILAKVTRDRLMRQYDVLYPEYNLAQHKGYPTAAHQSLVRKYGGSPIHRRSFAPLKHMLSAKEAEREET